MVKYKLVIRPANVLGNAIIKNNLSNLNGYLTHDNSLVDKGVLVNEDNVNEFLNNPQNTSIVDRFKKYIKEYTNEIEFKEIYYKPRKVAPILNDYYNEEVRFNSEANPLLIKNALSGTQVVNYTNNNFDFLSNERMKDENKSKLIEVLSASTTITSTSETFEVTTSPNYYRDFYINFEINIKEDSLYGTDYTKYFKDTIEDGVYYVNSFVDLNKKTDPFEYWTNNKPNRIWKSKEISDKSIENAKEKRVEDFKEVVRKLKLKEIKALESKQLNPSSNNELKYQIKKSKHEQAKLILEKVKSKFKREKDFIDKVKKRK